MTKQDLRLSMSTPASAEAVYDKISRVSEWWAKDFTGNAKNVGDKFTVRFGTTAVDFVVTEAVPGKKVVWHVTNSVLPWLKDQSEWTNTDVVFEISSGPSETTATLTHIGLVPEVECFNDCRDGWTRYFCHSLPQVLSGGVGSPM